MQENNYDRKDYGENLIEEKSLSHNERKISYSRNVNIIDEILKLKNLLDLNLITKEEFDLLKKDMLKN